MAELSPAAQAVLDAAAFSETGLRATVAAALCAAADQVEQKLRGFAHESCQEMRAIAAELRGTIAPYK